MIVVIVEVVVEVAIEATVARRPWWRDVFAVVVVVCGGVAIEGGADIGMWLWKWKVEMVVAMMAVEVIRGK